jgi:ATP-binding protein involved in chromosome partitioning
MTIDSQGILNALAQVQDPSTNLDIVAMQRIKDLTVDGKNVNFTLLLPTKLNAQKQNLIFTCMAAIENAFPGAIVNIHTTEQSGEEKGTNPFPHIKNIIAVASGKGGVGKSTVSVNLALGLKKLGAKVGIIDADLYGPSVPTMLNLKGQRPRMQELYGEMKILPIIAYDMPVMSIGFVVEPEQAVVLRGPRLAGILKQFFQDVLWETLDYLIVDLPPGTGDVQLTLIQTVPVTGVVMVTTPQQVAVIDAVKAMNMFLMPNVNVPILGVVENMSWFTPEELPDRKYYIFGRGGGKQLANDGNTLLLGQIPIVMSVREGGDSGVPVVLQEDSMVGKAFLELAAAVMRQTKFRNENLAPTRKVEVEK